MKILLAIHVFRYVTLTFYCYRIYVTNHFNLLYSYGSKPVKHIHHCHLSPELYLCKLKLCPL